MKKSNIIAAFFSILLISFSVACNKDKNNPPVPDEQELITTLQLRLRNDSFGFDKTFVYKVENGFGNTGGSIQIDTLYLKAATTYYATLNVLNEQSMPSEDITSEILEKSDEHLFLFQSTPESGNGAIVTSGGNKDKNNAPLNQTFVLSTQSSGNGNFKITLLHKPANKMASNVADAAGETDLEALFPTKIQ